MKNLKFKTISKYLLYLIVCVGILSCTDHDKYDKLILTDIKTGRVYRLEHNVGDTYFIDEQVIKIMGKDTITVFE